MPILISVGGRIEACRRISDMKYRALQAHDKTKTPGDNINARKELNKVLGLPPHGPSRLEGKWFRYQLPNGSVSPLIHFDVDAAQGTFRPTVSAHKEPLGYEVPTITRGQATDTLDAYIEGVVAHGLHEHKIKQDYGTIQTRMRGILQSFNTYNGAVAARPEIRPFLPKNIRDDPTLGGAHGSQQPTRKKGAKLFITVAATYQILGL